MKRAAFKLRQFGSVVGMIHRTHSRTSNRRGCSRESPEGTHLGHRPALQVVERLMHL